MYRITLSMMVFAAVGTARGQDPTPPRPPAARPAPATPAPRPAIAPRALPDLDGVRDLVRDMDLDYVRDNAREAMRFDREAQRAAMESAREASRAVDRDALRESREAQRASMEAARVAMADQRFEIDSHFDRVIPALPALPAIPAFAPMAPLPPLDAFGAGPAFSGSEGFRYRMPPAPWAQGDPADSLYRMARNALNSGEYGRAAKLFAEISKNYPKSSYQSDAVYYQALARYRVGTTEELKQAAKLLEPLASRSGSASNATTVAYNYSSRRNTSEADVAALYARINGVLAQRGDRDAAAIVSKAASTPGAPCDQDDLEVRAQALNALSQMDPGAAIPIIRRVLDRKDECSAQLRRSAVFMLARRGDNESAALLMQEAKSDPSVSVRMEAISFLPRIPGDAGLTALEEMLRSEQDERIQRAAVRALVSSDNVKARAGMRSLIDRKDAPLNLRLEAISSFNSEHATPDDAKYLRDLYGRADNDRVKAAVIDAVSRIGGAENDQWVLGIARNQNESSQLRSVALGRFTRSNTVSVADLNKLYDSADSYEFRNRVINILSARKEPEATDKLIDIVKTSTVVGLRTQAINALTRKNDPRATQLLMDILDGKRS